MTTTDDVFDAPARWRAESIERSGLRGARRAAAASPAPAFPQLLWFVTRHAAECPDGGVVDVGSGLGGVGEAVRAATGRHVVGCEPSWGSCSGARRLFPDAPTACARASALPVRSGAAAVVVLCGVASLVEHLPPVLDEAARILRPGGRLLLVDLVSSVPDDRVVGPNHFRSVETLRELIGGAGLTIVDVAIATPEVGEWSEVGEAITDDVRQRHRGEPGYDAWCDDLRHLGAVMGDGTVMVGGLAATT